MADPIDSSDDLQRQLEELEKADYEVGQPARSTFPTWVKWMILATMLIGISIVAIVFA